MTRTQLQSRAVSRARAGQTRLSTPCLGGWQLVDRVSEGELTHVFRARPARDDVNQSPAYALKMLRPERQDDPHAIAMLQREAVVGRQIAHPHLVPVLAARTRQTPQYLVMPWLEGTTLATRLETQIALDLPEILWIARQMAEALAALHGHGWMHGDIKPQNTMLSPAGHVTLLDLGFARRRNEEASVADRTVAGTCAYMAPELLCSRLRADIRSDLYSLGVVLFQAICGRLPFSGQTMPELISQHQQAACPDLRRFAPFIPSAVAELVRRLLAKDPMRRPQSPSELIDSLIALEISTFSERALA